MALTKRKLKGLIEYSDLRNEAGLYNEDDVIGVSTSKEMISTKANLDGVNLLNYKVFPPKSFAYVADTSRRGDKIALTYNNTSRTYIVSTWYVVFNLSEDAKDVLYPDFLFLYFNRNEFDRYARTNSWGSAREYFWFQDMEDVVVELPSIDVQRKYVDVYLSLQKNLDAYQSKVEELKLVCDGYIEELRRKMKCEKIEKYICRESKNTDGRINKVLGIGQNGFMEPQKEPNASLRNYKVLRKGDIAYAPPLYNILTGALHCYDGNEDAVCSPIYEVFKSDNNYLLPEYLTMWLKRDEFIRYAEFYAQGVRQTFEYSLMEDIEIPIPNISVQREIVNIHKCYIERQRIAEVLKEQLKNICPVLIRGSLTE